MKTIEELKRLNELITNNKIGKAKHLWGGADVAVVKEQPKTNPNGFYPDPFFVVSEKFSYEISWMFEQLKAVFYADNLVDYYTKDELFGRLARAANRGIFRNSEDLNGICMEILKEAQQIYGEITSNTFKTLPLTTGNTIAYDLKDAYIESFKDIADVVENNIAYFMGNCKVYSSPFVIPIDKDSEIKEEHTQESNSPLKTVINTTYIDGNENEYFISQEITHKQTGKKLSFYICRTNALYSNKGTLFRNLIKERGLIGVITLKNRFFVKHANYSISLVIFGENPSTKYFSSANSFEELYNLIFDKEKYKRSIFYCDESDVNYDNLLPENYDSKKISINKFLQDFEPKKLEDIAEIITCPSAYSYEYVKNGIPYYTAASIQNGNIVKADKFIATDNVERFSKALVQEGDILITKFFGQKKIAVVKKENLPGIASGMLFIIRPYEELNFDLFEYLSTGAGSKIFSKQLDSITVGTSIASINKKNLSSLPIPTITKDTKNSFEEAYISNFENEIVKNIANKILSTLKANKLEESIYESLIKAGWKSSDISREERFKYENKFLIPDFTLYFEGKPFAFVEAKSENLAGIAINQLKAIQKENNILAILALGGMYFEVYKFIDGEYKVYKFISNAPSKEELIKIFKEVK